MYNQSYISAFPQESNRNNYSYSFLQSKEELLELKDEYKELYSGGNAEAFAFKESLDHYVLKRLLTDSNFINTRECSNYFKYLGYILGLKRLPHSELDDYYPEFSSNVVIQNDKARHLLLNKFIPEIAERYEKMNLKQKRFLESIFKKMSNGEQIEQFEIDAVADYIYVNKNVDSQRTDIFINYIFNNIKEDSKITSSKPIMGALLNILSQKCNLDKEIHNSRFFLATSDQDRGESISEVRRAHSCLVHGYCVCHTDIADKLSLTGYNSLFKARQFQSYDLFWLMMVTFHELTHQHQKHEVTKNHLNSSSLSMIIHLILRWHLKKDGVQLNADKTKDLSDYNVNHDSYEIEMQADEEGWRQTRKIIEKYISPQNQIITGPDNKQYKMSELARYNEEVVRARRAFSRKKTISEYAKEYDKNEDLLGHYYADYDIKLFLYLIKHDLVQDSPDSEPYADLVNTIPALYQIFDNKGNLRPLEVLLLDLTTNSEMDPDGINKFNNSGIELVTYVIANYKDFIVKAAQAGNLNRFELIIIQGNMFNCIKDILNKSNDLKKISLETEVSMPNEISFDQYSETKTKVNFNQTQIVQKIYERHFSVLASVIDTYFNYIEAVKNTYGYINFFNFEEVKNALIEVYNNIPNKETNVVVKYLNRLRNSNNQYIAAIYQELIQSNEIHLKAI